MGDFVRVWGQRPERERPSRSTHPLGHAAALVWALLDRVKAISEFSFEWAGSACGGTSLSAADISGLRVWSVLFNTSDDWNV